MMARSLTGLGEVALSNGDRRAACAYLEQAVALTRTRSDRSGLSRALLALGLAESDTERACEHLLEVLELARQIGDLIVVARALDALAAMLAPDLPVEAIHLVGKAAALRTSLGVQPFPKDRERRDELVQLMRRNLGQLRFELAWNEGQKLSIDEALLLARRSQPRGKETAVEFP
jgi:tetratricopeptide (TPR) repeat protein